MGCCCQWCCSYQLSRVCGLQGWTVTAGCSCQCHYPSLRCCHSHQTQRLYFPLHRPSHFLGHRHQLPLTEPRSLHQWNHGGMPFYMPGSLQRKKHSSVLYVCGIYKSIKYWDGVLMHWSFFSDSFLCLVSIVPSRRVCSSSTSVSVSTGTRCIHFWL